MKSILKILIIGCFLGSITGCIASNNVKQLDDFTVRLQKELAFLLHNAIHDNDIDECERIIKAGADIDGYDHDGIAPLHHAAYYGRLEILQRLLALGASIDKSVTWAQGFTPLHYAARGGSLSCIKALLDAGADPYGRDIIINRGSSYAVGRRRAPLHIAAEHKKLECMRLLLKKECFALTDDCWSPLHWAIAGVNIEKKELILEAVRLLLPYTYMMIPQKSDDFIKARTRLKNGLYALRIMLEFFDHIANYTLLSDKDYRSDTAKVLLDQLKKGDPGKCNLMILVKKA